MVALRTPSMVMVAFPDVVVRAPMRATWSVQAAVSYTHLDVYKRQGWPALAASPRLAMRFAASSAAAVPWVAAVAGSIRRENGAQLACRPTYVGMSRQPWVWTAVTQAAERFAWAQPRLMPPKMCIRDRS